MLSSFLSSTCVLLVSIVLLLKASPAHAVPMPTPDIYRNVENFARNKWADVNYNIRNPIREERREVTLCVPQKYALACTSVCGSQLDASPERQTQIIGCVRKRCGGKSKGWGFCPGDDATYSYDLGTGRSIGGVPLYWNP